MSPFNDLCLLTKLPRCTAPEVQREQRAGHFSSPASTSQTHAAHDDLLLCPDLVAFQVQRLPEKFRNGICKQSAEFISFSFHLGAHSRRPQSASRLMQDLEEALFGPWRYVDDMHSWGWDPATLRLGALIPRAPTKMAIEGVAGAYWLAWESQPLFPVCNGMEHWDSSINRARGLGPLGPSHSTSTRCVRFCVSPRKRLLSAAAAIAPVSRRQGTTHCSSRDDSWRSDALCLGPDLRFRRAIRAPRRSAARSPSRYVACGRCAACPTPVAATP